MNFTINPKIMFGLFEINIIKSILISSVT